MFRGTRNTIFIAKSRWSMSNTRGGRPPKRATEKLKYRIVVKLCKADYYAFRAQASQAGVTLAELGRQVILGVGITPRLSTEQGAFIRALAGMANNLNQIARQANSAGYRDARSEYLHLACRIDNLLTDLGR